tara:strand:- start:338 stop:739 length:402 start_codon:yes stop_codon:yes gene_type:complete
MQSGTTSINTNRIYNPIKQGKDHDPKGLFIKKWVPELKLISENYIHEPWLIIDKSEYNLIKTSRYVNPIIDIKESSKKARKTLYEISLKKGYWDISKLIYEKHGSRKSLNKRKSYKKIKANTIHKQIELNINI